MRHRDTYTIPLIAAVISFLFLTGLSGCFNPVDDPGTLSPDSPDVNGNTFGSLVFLFHDTGTSRTIGPTGDLKALVTSWSISFSGHSGNEADFSVNPYTEGTRIEGIPAGTWIITLTGRDDNLHEIVRGTPAENPVTVFGGEQSIALTLRPIAGDETGTLLWTILFPAAEVDDAEISLDPWPAGGSDAYILEEITDYNDDFASTGNLSVDIDLASGYYVVSVVFSKQVEESPVNHPPVTEVVLIYDYLTSSASPTELSAADFTQPPAKPLNFSATTLSSSVISLEWDDTSSTESGFYLEWSFDESGSWTAVDTIAASVEEYEHTGLSGNTPYYYRLRSENDFGSSDWAEADAVTDALSVIYHGNGHTSGTVPTDGGEYAPADDITIAELGDLVNENDGISLLFTGWNTSSDGSEDSYDAGGNYQMPGHDLELWAQWSIIGGTGPAQGTVFYDKGNYTNGWRYLEVAPVATEEIDKPWGGYGYSAEETATAIGIGAANTELITLAYGESEPYAGAADYAAKLCSDLSNVSGSYTYNDWFLPSGDELSEMCIHLHDRPTPLGNFSIGCCYWSSREYDISNEQAYCFNFGDGSSLTAIKYSVQRVRAVRAFRSEKPSYIVLYHPNKATGGSVPTDPAFYESSDTVTVVGNTGSLSRTGFNFTFVGWNTEPDGSGDQYNASDTFIMSDTNVVLYAQWEASGATVGEEGPAGGWIFYDKGSYSDGWRYLEACLEDLDHTGDYTLEWGDQGTDINGNDDTLPPELISIGSGKINTYTIVQAIGDNGGTAYAAQLCYDYSWTNADCVYDDWFLPSEAELNLMYANLHNQATPLGGFSDTGYYWSSTERSDLLANFLRFDTGENTFNYKGSSYRVRPSRRF